MFVESISREIVYHEDVFNLTYGTSPGITHIPSEGERTSVRGYYAIVFLTNGGNIPMGRALWRLSAISGIMCLVTALMFGIGIGLWNRYLDRHGDQADRVVNDPGVALG